MPAHRRHVPIEQREGTDQCAGHRGQRGTDVNGCFAELSFALSTLAGVPTLPQAFVIVIFLGLL